MLSINDSLDFNLKNREGKSFSLKDLKGDFKVVYFYPKDDTSGCTVEAQEFTRDLDKYKKLKTAVVGISGGDKNTKRKFIDKYNLKVLLLSDSDFSVCKKYGVYGEKSFMGRKFLGIKRTTFALDKDNKIIKIYENVKPEGHSQDVLKFINSIKKV